MVCTNHCDTSIVKSLSQSLPVLHCLNGGITFDAGAERGVVLIAEIEMRNGSLSGNQLCIVH